MRSISASYLSFCMYFTPISNPRRQTTSQENLLFALRAIKLKDLGIQSCESIRNLAPVSVWSRMIQSIVIFSRSTIILPLLNWRGRWHSRRIFFEPWALGILAQLVITVSWFMQSVLFQFETFLSRTNILAIIVPNPCTFPPKPFHMPPYENAPAGRNNHARLQQDNNYAPHTLSSYTGVLHWNQDADNMRQH